MRSFIFDNDSLTLLLLIPILGGLHQRYVARRYPVLRITGVVPHVKSRRLYFSPPLVLLLINLLAVFFIVLAIADPRLATPVKTTVATDESDIVLSLDLSKSMLIEDIKPNRLEALKEVLNAFIATRRHDRIGIVLYAGESYSWCPLTNNRAVLLQKINTMYGRHLADGTAIGVGLTSAINALRQSKTKSKVIILITDGENNAGLIDPLTAAAMAKKLGIKVYTVGIGSTGMAPLPVTDINGNKSYVQIKVGIDAAMLGKIAWQTGGSFFRATDAGALRKIGSAIDKLQTRRYKEVTTVAYQSLYHWFVFIALALLLSGFVLKISFLRTWPA
jgi:Ca-activated chloride channel family protein